MKQGLEWDFQSQHCQAKQTVFEWVPTGEVQTLDTPVETFYTSSSPSPNLVK
jgi:hypothetical protein